MASAAPSQLDPAGARAALDLPRWDAGLAGDAHPAHPTPTNPSLGSERTSQCTGKDGSVDQTINLATAIEEDRCSSRSGSSIDDDGALDQEAAEIKQGVVIRLIGNVMTAKYNIAVFCRSRAPNDGRRPSI